MAARITRIVLNGWFAQEGIEFRPEEHYELSSGSDRGGVWFDQLIAPSDRCQGRPLYSTIRIPWTSIAWIEEE